MASLGCQPREGYVDVTGGRVWYQIVGSADTIPLLILHGGPGHPHDYLEPLKGLADERPVVFYDQLGCGKSDRPESAALWRVERFVQELGQVIEALGMEQMHILGHSWGSMLATDYALAKPLGLASLILASPPLSVQRWLQDLAEYRRQLPSKVQEVLARHEAAGTTDSEEYQAATLEFYKRHICRLDPWPDAMLRAEAGENKVVYNTMWGPAEFYMTGNLSDYDRTSRLHEIAVPVLFTCGRHDEASPDTTGWYHSLVPRSELVVFEDSSHTPHLEETESYLETVRRFLRSVELKLAL